MDVRIISATLTATSRSLRTVERVRRTIIAFGIFTVDDFRIDEDQMTTNGTLFKGEVPMTHLVSDLSFENREGTGEYGPEHCRRRYALSSVDGGRGGWRRDFQKRGFLIKIVVKIVRLSLRPMDAKPTECQPCRPQRWRTLQIRARDPHEFFCTVGLQGINTPAKLPGKAIFRYVPMSPRPVGGKK